MHKGPEDSPHNHAPDMGEVKIFKALDIINKAVEEHPEALYAAHNLRVELRDDPPGLSIITGVFEYLHASAFILFKNT